MKSAKVVLLITLLGLVLVDAKIYKKCNLAKELVEKLGFSRTLVSMWMCMIVAENKELDTKKVAEYKPLVTTGASPYKSYGLFQINSQHYCRVGYVGGFCKMRCEDLLTDDIKKSAQCAQIVLNKEGFKAWKQWEAKCKPPQSNPPAVNNCFEKSAKVIAG
ncbi:lysozyme-like isoform X2 [Contarinia nasturtii]|nr:lysozyme-like isoform X2 [Contarinia nasturtii]XP_031630477.1 lysozyme-like isoform X2 [Contarinia nasturtii]